MGENKRATRDGFGDAILEIGKTNPDIYVVDIDIGKSCKTGAFSKELPAQHVNVGIAEQNGAGVAAGLATTGIIPLWLLMRCSEVFVWGSRFVRRCAIPI